MGRRVSGYFLESALGLTVALPALAGWGLVAAAAFAVILRPDPPLFIALHAGFLTGLAYVAMSFGINYAFAGRSFKLWLIDGGYHTLQFTLYGLILGLWH